MQSIAQLIDEERDRLDRLAAQLAEGISHAGHFDELEAEASSIGCGLRDAFRKGRRG